MLCVGLTCSCTLFALDYEDFPNISKRCDITANVYTSVVIEVTDDAKNEAIQTFVVMLEVIDVFNPSLVTLPLQRKFSLIHITDNDRKCDSVIMCT